MTDMNVANLGKVNGAGDDKALFLKMFSGEVLTAYEENNVMDALHLTRTIVSGKSASFPATWKVGAGYHTPGAQLLGSQSMNKNEMIISIDDLLVSDVFLANVEEAMAHVDYRSIYSAEVGAALARASDLRTLQTAILTARSAAIVTGKPGGAAITQAAAKTDGNLLAAAISSGAVAMDEKDVPEAGRSVILKPAQTHLLSQTKDVVHKDTGGDGSTSTGYIGSIDNVRVVKSNNVPQSIIAAVPGENNPYDGTFTNTVGVIMHSGAIGTVKLMDLSVEMTGHDFKVTNQGTLIVGKYLKGHGKLRPECAVEIKTA